MGCPNISDRYFNLTPHLINIAMHWVISVTYEKLVPLLKSSYYGGIPKIRFHNIPKLLPFQKFPMRTYQGARNRVRSGIVANTISRQTFSHLQTKPRQTLKPRKACPSSQQWAENSSIVGIIDQSGSSVKVALAVFTSIFNRITLGK